MELTQVRYFLTLARTLNFTRAAELCNVTQPAFSRAIQRLEEEMGGPLVFRERNATTLTALGRDLLPHLTAMAAAAEAAQALSLARRGGARPALKIGLGPGIGAAAIAPMIGEVSRLLPELSVQFIEQGPGALIEAMLEDRLDCALLPGDADMPERLNRWPLYEDCAVAVLPASHPLAAHNRLGPGDIEDETILVGERCGGFAQRLEALTGRPLRQSYCHGAVSQMLDLVAAGLGIALLSARLSYAPAVAVRAFGEPALTRPIVLTALAGRPLGAAASSFVRLCRAQSFA
jgi:DNA-binding transcriptional LysR family regulator